MLARERARAEFQDWEKKEEEVCCFDFIFASLIYIVITALSILYYTLVEEVTKIFYLQFHFDQSKIRSHIRLQEGRMKPIDVLSKHLNVSDDLDIEINEPYMVFKVKVDNIVFLHHAARIIPLPGSFLFPFLWV